MTFARQQDGNDSTLKLVRTMLWYKGIKEKHDEKKKLTRSARTMNEELYRALKFKSEKN